MSDRDAYAEGYEAYDLGHSESDNPYDLDTEEEDHLAWNDGWSAAQEDE